MKILHYHKSMRLETGGVVRAVLDLTGALATAGHAVTLLTSDTSDLPANWLRGEDDVPRTVELPLARRLGGRFDRMAMDRIRTVLSDQDVLHLHSMWTPSNIQFASLARRLGVPYVYSVHGMLDDWCMSQRTLKKKLYLGLWGRRVLHEAGCVLCTAEAELQQAKKWFPRGQGRVIPLVFDLAPFEHLPGPELARQTFAPLTAEDDIPTALFLSRIHYKKGVELLLRAAARLKREGLEFRTCIAGTDAEGGRYTQSLQRLSAELGVDDIVHFLGFVSGAEKVSLFQSADVFVLPTSQENFGFVLFEALAAGTPVVTTRGVDTWPELNASGGSTIVESSVEDVSNAMRMFLSDRHRAAEMGAAGRRWVHEHLEGSRIVQRYVSLYEECARKQ